jgi:RNA polymerase primary sigma factor
MTSKTKPTPRKAEVPKKETPEAPDTALPLLDLSDAAVKKLIRTAKKRGYVTHEQINSALPSEEASSERIEDILTLFSELGVNVVDAEEASDEEEQREELEEETEAESGELVEVQRAVSAKSYPPFW